jgi:hypothetical protein
LLAGEPEKKLRIDGPNFIGPSLVFIEEVLQRFHKESARFCATHVLSMLNPARGASCLNPPSHLK